jgi:cytochrome c556
MKNLLVLVIGLAACGGGAASSRGSSSSSSEGGSPKLLHSSPELNNIMKVEVNQPFSALQFLVFHAQEANPSSSELDYDRIMTPAATLREGISKVRAIVDPPTLTQEGRAVFFTYVDSMVRDTDALSDAIARRDRARTEKLVGKISTTCNDCHHFFRLKIEDTPSGR